MGGAETKVYQTCQYNGNCGANLVYGLWLPPYSNARFSYHICNECGATQFFPVENYHCQLGHNWSICGSCKRKYTFQGYHGLAGNKSGSSIASMQGTGELGTGVYTSTDIMCCSHFSRDGGSLYEIYSTKSMSIKTVNTKSGEFIWGQIPGSDNNNSAIDRSVYLNGFAGLYNIIDYKIDPKTWKLVSAPQTKFNVNSYGYLRKKKTFLFGLV